MIKAKLAKIKSYDNRIISKDKLIEEILFMIIEKIKSAIDIGEYSVNIEYSIDYNKHPKYLDLNTFIEPIKKILNENEYIAKFNWVNYNLIIINISWDVEIN